ncbi:NAD(P)H-hydrate dehydratase [Novisyntrophococcus fermenticellae]|uniref:NAD(P)H-hydrate dehydratase n=1 Tax=Novisyntrophococcus fermenticellae TaxID=2068655 RepID=UPI001E356D3E|nr:NAD(P)H-hydrate dehydratase [Novisyntrophococcus fermenticellae]
MKRVISSRHMKALDAYTIENIGIPSPVLMEQAALAVVDCLQSGRYATDNILVVCGSGNNGGDGVAAARILHLKGYKVSVFTAAHPEKYSDGMKTQVQIARNYQVNFVTNPDYGEYTVIVDAVFGVGLARPITGNLLKIVEQINFSKTPVVAVDIPSGLHADTGAVMGGVIRAEETVTFAFLKPGLLLGHGQTCAGKITVADIGIYETGNFREAEPELPLFKPEEEDLLRLPIRMESGNKGTFGKVLLIAGSGTMAGAAILSGRACLRAGAGMLKIYTTTENRDLLLTSLPEALLSVYEPSEPVTHRLQKDMEWADVIGIGPGISTEPYAARILEYVLNHKGQKPCVIDADALNLLSLHMSLLKMAAPPCILTPHIGEFSRLTGISVSELKSNLYEAAGAFICNYGVTCICKDARTLTMMPDGTGYINTSGNSALATAGSGDVLTGLILGLLAQTDGHNDIHIVPFTVYLHGLLGQRASMRLSKAGVLASDLIEELTIQNEKIEALHSQNCNKTLNTSGFFGNTCSKTHKIGV